MILVKPSSKIEHITPGALERIEFAARTCYKSEDRITNDSALKFVKNLVDRGHEAMLEHASMTVRFICDRGVSHELVRHRLCAFAQESTRYCNYKGGVTFVIPPWVDIEPGEYKIPDGMYLPSIYRIWMDAMHDAASSYCEMLKYGWTPQQARSVLPNSLKTEIVITANLREWRHIFRMRTASAAHPQMREIMIPLLEEVKCLIPVLFEDVQERAEG